jgi:hypothetical protein
MVAVAVVMALLTLASFLWFRRTAMYRAHRQYGIYQGETWSARSSGAWRGSIRPPLRPDLRPDADPRRPRSRHWWTGSKRQSGVEGHCLTDGLIPDQPPCQRPGRCP